MQRVYEENEWGKVSKRIVTGRGSDGGCRCSDINSHSGSRSLDLIFILVIDLFDVRVAIPVNVGEGPNSTRRSKLKVVNKRSWVWI